VIVPIVQKADSEDEPTQFAPPFDGDGFVQDLVLVLLPFEQIAHADHADQPPLMGVGVGVVGFVVIQRPVNE